MEAVARRPDGTQVPFLAYPTPLFDASGALVGAVNMLVDISETRRAEQQQAALHRFTDRLYVNRRWIFTPDRRAIETPLVDGLERVGDLSCVA